jgi:predicted nucleic acid-binding protein
LTSAEYAVLLRQFHSDQELGLWEWLPVDTHTLLEARRRYQKLSPRIFLRSADAIHLSSALTRGFREIFTNDRHLLAACPVFGILGRNLLTS